MKEPVYFSLGEISNVLEEYINDIHDELDKALIKSDCMSQKISMMSHKRLGAKELGALFQLKYQEKLHKENA